MDEFDKIREISEDLTHRKEPTFENSTFSQVSHSESAEQAQPQNTPAEDSLLKMAFQHIQSENETPFTSPFANDSAFQDSLIEEKHFPSMKLHLIGLSLFAGILGVVLAGFFMFNSEPEDISEVVTITAEPTIVKELPEQAGGMNIPDQDKLVYNRIRSDNVTTKVESLFPEPEKPVMPQILAIEENAPDEKFVDMNAVKPINPLDETIQDKLEPSEKPKLPPQSAHAQAPVAPTQPEVLMAKPSLPEPQKTEEKLVEPVKIVEVEPVKTAEKETAKPESVKSNASEQKTTQPKAAESAKPTETAKPVQKGAWRAQLFASNNKPAVEKAWKKIQSQQKDLLSNLPYEIESATIANKGQFYRLKVGGFASRDEAADLCAKLKTRKQDCVPTK